VEEAVLIGLVVPIALFIVVVAPIWIILHYRTKSKEVDGLTSRERTDLQELAQVANKMAARIETLEAILDVETPGWREKQSAG
jgi:phage shock protein B